MSIQALTGNTEVTIIAVTFSVLLYDLYLWARGQKTISQVIIKWSKDIPFIPFMGGFLAGHLWG